MNRALPWNTQDQDVRIFVTLNANRQSTTKKFGNKTNFFRAVLYPEVSLLFSAVSVTSVWNPASPKAAHKTPVNNCSCTLHKRYFFRPSTSKVTYKCYYSPRNMS